MSDFKIALCPRCRGVVAYRPGLPPGKGTDVTNRCQCRALTGQPGAPSRSAFNAESWAFPERHPIKLCLTPLTDASGNLIPPMLSLDEFIARTRVPFDPETFEPSGKRPGRRAGHPNYTSKSLQVSIPGVFGRRGRDSR